MSEWSMSLPPRHIRRYPTTSTTSSSSSTAGPGSLRRQGRRRCFSSTSRVTLLQDTFNATADVSMFSLLQLGGEWSLGMHRA